MTAEQAAARLAEEQAFSVKSRRVLPRIEAKKQQYPGWHAVCPKSGCDLTLADIEDELRAYLEESEEEAQQLVKHLEKLGAGKDGPPAAPGEPKARQPGGEHQLWMEL